MRDLNANSESAAPPPVSRRFQRFFGWYARRYLGKHMHALRVRMPAMPPVDSSVPIVVYLNHASWWDPLVSIIIAREFFPDRLHYGPIDEKGLRQYRFLSRVGFFGIEPGSLRGARQFLDAATAICSTPNAALWITPQGRFADPRERPARFEPGLGHLLRRLDSALVLPVAIEYPFWTERTPEALAVCGPPMMIEADERVLPNEWTARLARVLESGQDEAARLAIARDTRAFHTVVEGRSGVGGIYDLWRGAFSLLRGRNFRRAHGDVS